MALPDFFHGVRVLEVTDGVRLIRTVATAVIGIVGTAADADPLTFPSDKPVLITDVASAIGKAGVTGTLANALRGIGDQASPIVVVVRTEVGVDPAATDAKVIGTNALGIRTGMQALLTAESVLGVRPRILATPGLESEAVTTALAIVAEKLNAMAYAVVPDADTVAEVIAYRQNFSARELCLLWEDFEAFDVVAAATARRYAAGVACGLRAQIDQQIGWNKTLSNVPVAGVTGVTKPISWSLQDPNTDAGLLNAAGVTVLIQKNGYRFWGNRTCSDAIEFQFESAARTAQILKDTIAEGLMWAADKELTASLARDIIETINGKIRSLTREGRLLGGSAWLVADLNPTEELAGGKLVIDYDYTPTPPLENLQLRQKITDRYFGNFADLVAAA